MHQIARVLRIARAFAGVTPYAMAKRVGLSRYHYRSLESGRIGAGKEALRKISKTIGISESAVVLLSMEMPEELKGEVGVREMWEQLQDHLMKQFVTSKSIKEG